MLKNTLDEVVAELVRAYQLEGGDTHGEAMDGDEVDTLTEIVRAKLNLHQGNITHAEYVDEMAKLDASGGR